jgi:hypothetical protein
MFRFFENRRQGKFAARTIRRCHHATLSFETTGTARRQHERHFDSPVHEAWKKSNNILKADKFCRESRAKNESVATAFASHIDPQGVDDPSTYDAQKAKLGKNLETGLSAIDQTLK